MARLPLHDRSALPGPGTRFSRGSLLRGALASPSFRWFAAAQFASFALLTVQMITRGWQMQEMTHSPFMVSLVPALQVLPMLAFGFLGGELATRFSRKWVLIAGEVMQLAGFAALAIPAWFGVAQPWHILATTFWLGVAMALQSPARQALVVDLVGEKDQRKALGVYMIVIHLTILVGPLAGGPVLTGMGVKWALLLSTVLFALALPLYLPIRAIRTQLRPKDKGGIVRNLTGGLKYISGEPSLRWMFIAFFVMVVFINTWGALFPTFAEDVLHRGASGLSAINVAVGIGALSGALLSNYISTRMPDSRQQFIGGGLFALFIILLSVSPSYLLALVATVLASTCGALFFISNLAATQLSAPEEFRGRVVSVRYIVGAFQPVGQIMLGAAAEEFGPRAALGGSVALGVVLLAAVAVTLARRELFGRNAGAAVAPKVQATEAPAAG